VSQLNPTTVKAVFEIQGHTFIGVNPTEREPRNAHPIEGLSAVNNDEFKMHAEIDAMIQAQKQGLKGGIGILKVDGRIVCPYCKGDIKKMAQRLRLEKLTIIDADEKIYVFKGENELKPVKNGGKGWKIQHS